MKNEEFKAIEEQLLKTIQGNGLEILRFMNWLKKNYTNKQKMCMSCEKIVNVNEGIFTCYKCSE